MEDDWPVCSYNNDPCMATWAQLTLMKDVAYSGSHSANKVRWCVGVASWVTCSKDFTKIGHEAPFPKVTANLRNLRWWSVRTRWVLVVGLVAGKLPMSRLNSLTLPPRIRHTKSFAAWWNWQHAVFRKGKSHTAIGGKCTIHTYFETATVPLPQTTSWINATHLLSPTQLGLNIQSHLCPYSVDKPHKLP